MAWTTEQQQVIDARRANLTVSAAAGSGKTAVLVERICSLIIGEGADVERMLVATCTRAAAAEMRGRIVERLARAAAEGEGSAQRRLHDQLNKIDRASIGTLHGFCGDLLRQYYNIVGLEPSFKTEDDTVTAGIFDETLDGIVDEFFERGEAGFMELAECWGGREGDGLKELAGKIYGAVRNYPDPMGWLRDKTALFRFEDGTKTAWNTELIKMLTADIEIARESLGEAIVLASRPGGPTSYLPRLMEDKAAVDGMAELAATGQVEELTARLGDPALFGRLPAWKDAGGTGLGERAKCFREEAKKSVRCARENPVVCEFDKACERTRAMAQQMDALYALIAAFDERYTEEKRYMNVLDFSDLEHLALQVLADDSARAEIREAYDYIFVDEYQDISPIQDELLRRVSKPGTFFCVGDVKQSIYRFRSAEPEIFIRRLAASLASEGAAERKIGLNRNFRSAGRVLSLANYLFSHLMSVPLGGVEYAGGERLVQGAPQPAAIQQDCRNELILIDNGGKKEEELSRLEELIQIEREATVVAQRIKRLVGTTIWDGKLGKPRELRYQDIAVLMRTISYTASVYADIFRREGIPVYAEAEGGFADEIEVQLIVNVLRLLDNANRDYELITSMYSAIGRFTLEDLVEIRGLSPEGSFADAVYRYAKNEDTDLSARVQAFLTQIGRWRALAAHADIEKLIFRVCEDTGYLEYIGALPEGERRQSNILHLGMLARSATGGLYDFLRNFERLAAAGASGRPSGLPTGSVIIMSVHKSKGLEFPVVILANVGKLMNLMDAGESMLIHGELGLGPRFFDAEKRTRGDTLARAAIASRMRQDTLSEEMRVLYVAVTRARERLIVVGTVADLAGRVGRWAMPLTAAGLSSRARSWADWIGPMALRTESGSLALAAYGTSAEVLEDGPDDWDVTVVDAAGIHSMRPERACDADGLMRLLDELEKQEIPEDFAAALLWQYPWGDVAALPSKVSATSLLDRQRNWRGPIPAPEIRRLPRFIEGTKTFSATDLGTFAHAALQLLPFDVDPAAIPEAVADLERRGLMPEGAAGAINLQWIERFYRSSIASRVRKSSQVKRELPFNLAVPAHVVYAGETSGEEILVQGIIDCCFIEDGQWVLLDYKTNRIDSKNSVEKTAEYYKRQLQTYRSALEEITGIPVREAYLYLLSVGEEVRVVL